MELPGIRLTDKQLLAFVVVPLFLLFARYGLHDPRQGPAAPRHAHPSATRTGLCAR